MSNKIKPIIEKITNNDKKIVILNENNATEKFTYTGADIIVIRDYNGNNWYYGESIASILKYKDTLKALTEYVDNEYKKYYYELEKVNEIKMLGKFRIDPLITFIDDSGLFQLVSRSKKPEAVKLWRNITKEILPELFATETYTLPSKDNIVKNTTLPQEDEYIKTINDLEHKYGLLNVKYESSLEKYKLLENNYKAVAEINKLLR
ncbi:Bro-N domain-containing protein [Megavirus chiliensis]|uniref:Bro-N domain-containing n=2 Tax=Megamimivirinae TaxID=3044648 RepID=A0A2L2DL23_MIMIV|nr:Bro-N domain-containing protein [Megavirus chiliensis]AEQ32638.1 Bro-N domain-containing protein [Megavirus chiliensis]AVG46855.1 Bro-N domain-containing [Acanthamoeba polyphaga mimivirus]